MVHITAMYAGDQNQMQSGSYCGRIIVFNDPKHPEVSDDVGRSIHIEEYAGFDSAIALLRWFKGHIPGLLRDGYEIVALKKVIVTGRVTNK